MFYKIFLLLTILFCSPLLVAQTPIESGDSNKSILFGHNLTPTTETLRKGVTTVGVYAIGYGITDDLTVATTPWFDYFYNMANIDFKYVLYKNDNFRLMVEDLFFQTYNYDSGYGVYIGGYEQISTFLRFAASERISNFYTLIASVGDQYFWNDTRPYSFRLVPGNADPYTWSVSSLHEFHLGQNWGIFLEGGVTGINYTTPYLHWAASIFAQWNWGMLDIGEAVDQSMGAVYGAYYYKSAYAAVDITIHPELQAQIFF